MPSDNYYFAKPGSGDGFAWSPDSGACQQMRGYQYDRPLSPQRCDTGPYAAMASDAWQRGRDCRDYRENGGRDYRHFRGGRDYRDYRDDRDYRDGGDSAPSGHWRSYDNGYRQQLDRAHEAGLHFEVEASVPFYREAIRRADAIPQDRVARARYENLQEWRAVNRQLRDAQRHGAPEDVHRDLLRRRYESSMRENELYDAYLAPAVARANAGMAGVASGQRQFVREGHRLIRDALEMRPEIEFDPYFRFHVERALFYCYRNQARMQGWEDPIYRGRSQYPGQGRGGYREPWSRSLGSGYDGAEFRPVDPGAGRRQQPIAPGPPGTGRESQPPGAGRDGQPAQPFQPGRPVQPVQPVQPVEPVQPVQPVQPVRPVRPVQPGPDKPVVRPPAVDPRQNPDWWRAPGSKPRDPVEAPPSRPRNDVPDRPPDEMPVQRTLAEQVFTNPFILLALAYAGYRLVRRGGGYILERMRGRDLHDERFETLRDATRTEGKDYVPVKAAGERKVKAERKTSDFEAKVGGKTEKGKPGDWLVTHPDGKQEIMENDKFEKAFSTTGEKDTYTDKRPDAVKAQQLTEAKEFIDRAGKTRSAKPGEWLVERNGNLEVMPDEDFKKEFREATADEKLLIALKPEPVDPKAAEKAAERAAAEKAAAEKEAAERAAAEKAAADARSERDQFERKMQQLETNQGELEKRALEAERRLAEQNRAGQEEKGRLERQVADLKGQQESLSARAAEAEQKLGEAGSDKAQLEKTLAELRKAEALLVLQLQEAQKNLADREQAEQKKALEQEKQLTDLRAEQKKLEAELAEAKKNHGDMQRKQQLTEESRAQEKAAFDRRLQELTGAQTDSQTRIAAIEGELKRAGEQAQAERSRYEKAVAELIATQKDLAGKLKDAEGRAAKNGEQLAGEKEQRAQLEKTLGEMQARQKELEQKYNEANTRREAVEKAALEERGRLERQLADLRAREEALVAQAKDAHVKLSQSVAENTRAEVMPGVKVGDAATVGSEKYTVVGADGNDLILRTEAEVDFNRKDLIALDANFKEVKVAGESGQFYRRNGTDKIYKVIPMTREFGGAAVEGRKFMLLVDNIIAKRPGSEAAAEIHNAARLARRAELAGPGPRPGTGGDGTSPGSGEGDGGIKPKPGNDGGPKPAGDAVVEKPGQGDRRTGTEAAVAEFKPKAETDPVVKTMLSAERIPALMERLEQGLKIELSKTDKTTAQKADALTKRTRMVMKAFLQEAGQLGALDKLTVELGADGAARDVKLVFTDGAGQVFEPVAREGANYATADGRTIPAGEAKIVLRVPAEMAPDAVARHLYQNVLDLAMLERRATANTNLQELAHDRKTIAYLMAKPEIAKGVEVARLAEAGPRATETKLTAPGGEVRVAPTFDGASVCFGDIKVNVLAKAKEKLTELSKYRDRPELLADELKKAEAAKDAYRVAELQMFSEQLRGNAEIVEQWRGLVADAERGDRTALAMLGEGFKATEHLMDGKATTTTLEALKAEATGERRGSRLSGLKGRAAPAVLIMFCIAGVVAASIPRDGDGARYRYQYN